MAFSETNSGHCWSNQKSGELLNLIPCAKEQDPLAQVLPNSCKHDRFQNSQTKDLGNTGIKQR